MTAPSESGAPTIADIEAAATRIAPYAHHTPVLTCRALDALCDAELYFKCENFQKVGAFKFRGAVNAVFSLSDAEARSGVATHSSGNHAQALALAARLRGITATIVMPDNAPRVKREAVAGYGAEIVPCRPTLQAREDGLAEVVSRTGAAFIHPYDDERVIAGQGTAALELCTEVPNLDVVTTPVGGGGLLSGTALSVQALNPDCAVIAAEPAGADDAWRSLQAGKIIPSHDPHTIADGLLTSLGEKTFPIIQRLVQDIVTVEDTAIVTAMKLIWERMKIVVEPSAAVPLAAIMSARDRFPGRRIGVILSGGNVDLDRLPWL
jgi:threonine dehydratase